jgi:hypothetical protein
MAIKYTNIFHSKTLQNLPKFGFLVLKYTIWQPCTQVTLAELAWHHWLSSVIKKTAHQKLSPTGRKFAQSGHPDCGLLLLFS